MRLNKYIAVNSALSRRSADMAIEQGKITVNGKKAVLGSSVSESDHVAIEGVEIRPKKVQRIIVLIDKPVGYVSSKHGQGSPTVYDLLPSQFKNLNIAGRLDKDSCGLLLLTNDGEMLYELTHPSQEKIKVYEVVLDKQLTTIDKTKIEQGVSLNDGTSRLKLNQRSQDRTKWEVIMNEGRNRQIRRTFSKLGYKVQHLKRTRLGDYTIDQLAGAKFLTITI